MTKKVGYRTSHRNETSCGQGVLRRAFSLGRKGQSKVYLRSCETHDWEKSVYCSQSTAKFSGTGRGWESGRELEPASRMGLFGIGTGLKHRFF